MPSVATWSTRWRLAGAYKEQLKKNGGMKFYEVNFRYVDAEINQEKSSPSQSREAASFH